MNGGNLMYKSVKTDLITIEEINQILINYRIGKKPLAKLLGWGETTLIRYLDGDSPTREYSDKLLYILNNPGYFYEILQQNQDRLTPVAYRKCNQAVKRMMLESKIRVVAQYIINKLEGHISMYELQIYLYYVQGFYLAFEKQPMFDDDFMINEQDLPYEAVYEEFSIRSFSIMELEKDSLSEKERQFIEDVVLAISWYGPTMLSRILHYEMLLMKLSRDWDNRRIISKETLKEYFSGVLQSEKITSCKQIQLYIHRAYIRLQEVEWNI